MDLRQTRSNVNVNLEISLHYLPFITSNEGKLQYTSCQGRSLLWWDARLKWSFMKCVSLAHFLSSTMSDAAQWLFWWFSMSIIIKCEWVVIVYGWNLMIFLAWFIFWAINIFSLIAPNRSNLLELILMIAIDRIENYLCSFIHSFNSFFK